MAEEETVPLDCTDEDSDSYAIEGGLCGSVDCNDSNSDVNPGATEVCNGIDDDCDTIIDNSGDALCDDGVYCNGAETCDGVLGCQAGTAVDCDDSVGCTDDSCNEQTDSCDNTADDANCDDSLYCNGYETCHAVNDCQAGTAVDCSDNCVISSPVDVLGNEITIIGSSPYETGFYTSSDIFNYTKLTIVNCKVTCKNGCFKGWKKDT